MRVHKRTEQTAHPGDKILEFLQGHTLHLLKRFFTLRHWFQRIRHYLDTKYTTSRSFLSIHIDLTGYF